MSAYLPVVILLVGRKFGPISFTASFFFGWQEIWPGRLCGQKTSGWAGNLARLASLRAENIFLGGRKFGPVGFTGRKLLVGSVI